MRVNNEEQKKRPKLSISYGVCDLILFLIFVFVLIAKRWLWIDFCCMIQSNHRVKNYKFPNRVASHFKKSHEPEVLHRSFINRMFTPGNKMFKIRNCRKLAKIKQIMPEVGYKVKFQNFRLRTTDFRMNYAWTNISFPGLQSKRQIFRNSQ